MVLRTIGEVLKARVLRKDKMLYLGITFEDVMKSIDKFFDDESDEIANNLNSIDKYSSELFNGGVEKNVSKSIQFKTTNPGIYIFRMNNTVKNQNGCFDKVSAAPKLNGKNHSKLRIKKDSDFLADQILYLGKSEESVFKRLNEHITYNENNKTYALKLSDENRSNVLGNIDVFVFELKEEYIEFVKTILSSIESHLHDKLLPRVGSKK